MHPRLRNSNTCSPMLGNGVVPATAVPVAAAAIVILNWPHPSHPQVVEPGMLADQPMKVMAPSAGTPGDHPARAGSELPLASQVA